MDCLKNQATQSAICCGFAVAILLIVILVPLSFSYVDYYEYGLNQRKTTGSVDISRVFSRGRYLTGPDFKFLHYQADAHFESLSELSVFSAGASNESIGLEFRIDVDFTYLLKQEEIGELHQQLAGSYRGVVLSRARDAIKNEAIFVTFNEYFQERIGVEERFKAAVQRRWDSNPSVHCNLDQFHLGRIRIPESVARKQLESRVQNERNDRETFLQQAQVEREVTAVEVNSIDLQRINLLRRTEAEATLLRSIARVKANQIRAEAQINGTVNLFRAAGISSQEHMTAFTYIRTLQNRENVDLDVSFLTPENVLRTQPAF